MLEDISFSLTVPVLPITHQQGQNVNSYDEKTKYLGFPFYKVKLSCRTTPSIPRSTNLKMSYGSSLFTEKGFQREIIRLTLTDKYDFLSRCGGRTPWSKTCSTSSNQVKLSLCKLYVERYRVYEETQILRILFDLPHLETGLREIFCHPLYFTHILMNM